MSLHDVSKNHSRRALPSPNQNDGQSQRMAHNTNQTSYKTDSDSAHQRLTHKNALILTYDDANRVSSAYGYIPEVSSIPVLIIANEGYDVFEDILGISAPTV